MRKELNNIGMELDNLRMKQELLRFNLTKLQSELSLYNDDQLVNRRAVLEGLVNECLHYIGEEERK
jgi:hypothetical protein